jgi:DUF1680 family protein
VNLFIESKALLTVRNKSVQLVQQNNYPWQGALTFTVNPQEKSTFNVLIRIPGWAKDIAMPSGLYKFDTTLNQQIDITINGKPVQYTVEKGYAVIKKEWQKNDKIQVELPMQVRRVIADNNLSDDRGKVALQRGPIMYCAEWVDNNGKTSNLIVPDNATFTPEFKPDMLNGITVLKGNVPAVDVSANGLNINTKTQPFVAIPYYAWANRGKGEMMVWFPKYVKDVDLITQ